MSVNFKVDSRLSNILGAGYSTCERALRELIDNAWDAEARKVSVTLPQPMTDDPIIIQDDGHGMLEQEIKSEYLNIANPRIFRKGERTPQLNRLVKGRRGIGKFAGLLVANVMEVQTKADGLQTTLVIKKEELTGDIDIESVPLDCETVSCNSNEHGTQITLRNLNHKFSHPDPECLKEILALDYGKEQQIEIVINGERVTNYDVKGEKFSKEIKLPSGDVAVLNFTIADKSLSRNKSGIVYREGNKSIGRPRMWGLEDDGQLSDKLRNRVVGEIVVPHDVVQLTAGGIDLIESDKILSVISQEIQQEVKQKLQQTHSKEFNLAKGRWQKLMNERLVNIPECRRVIVKKRLESLISRSYQEGEKDEKITILVELVLDALEIDEYWTVCHEIEGANKEDVIAFARTLSDFGLVDMACIASQANRRLKFLEQLNNLAQRSDTLEKQMHDAIANNMWVFGPQYSLMASNKTLKNIVENNFNIEYGDTDKYDRPDLILTSNADNRHLLIEFKRPSITIGRDAESQAKKYADTITGTSGMNFEIFIIGGKVDPKLQQAYNNENIRFLSYQSVIATAQNQLNWLLKQLDSDTKEIRLPL